MMKFVVLRIGHRPMRDKRITTHVGLTARALGADGMLLAANDPKIKKSIDDVTRTWGGDFFVEIDVDWRREINEWKERGGMVVHLTMYGLNLADAIDKMQNRDLLLIVGAEKVRSVIYDLADLNVAVGNQPHSEVAALALVLDHLQEGKELCRTFNDGEREIIPMRKGKRVIEHTALR
ncbi:tRNA (cytidine(56)-2'-O)-methyltransferase [ANME-2 cluster archaeon]|nr:MAG: tRNA (cytidine(56)-2'-O)-methyltransferase [ANME-2 cluster archaeon]